MYSKLPSLTIGFHGCDSSVYDKVIKENHRLNKSENKYDWLGHGIYCWENNLQRAYEFAEFQKSRGKIKDVAVIGLIIDLGYCLDFVNSEYLQLLRVGYELLKAEYQNASIDLPKNKLMEEEIPLSIDRI